MARSKYARSDFNIRIDGDNPDSLLSSNMKELRLDQLNRKINVLFLIILILIGVLSAAAYFELKGRTSDKNTKQDAKIKKTLEGMASEYSALSDKITHTEESVSNRLAALEKKAVGLNSGLAKINKNLNLLSSSKTSKHELKQITSKVDKLIAPYQEKIDKITSQIKQSDKNFKQELFLLADALDKNKNKNSGLSQTVAGYKKKLDEIQKTTQQQQDNLIRLIETFEQEKENWTKLSKLIIQKNNQPVELPDKIKRDIEAINQLQTELLTLTKNVVFKKTLDSALARNRKTHKQNLDRMEQNLRTKIASLQKKFLQFEKKMSSSIIIPKSKSSSKTKRKRTGDKSSGTIFEMDIQ
ncbi:hypothetical protein QUF90_12040 [Desulfococcaceae bacterium HSG9]|nr:hypothetical protein [Desulfococcaceae bacterium HSG9]